VADRCDRQSDDARVVSLIAATCITLFALQRFPERTLD
jgi:hypothetical protein